MTTSNAGPRPASFVPSRKKPYFRALLVATFLVSGAGGVWRLIQPVSVATAPVARGTAIEAVYATATIEAADRVTVKARAQGVVERLEVRVGDPVKKGDVLARIDSPSLRFQLDRGKADRNAAQRLSAPGSPQVAAIEAQARMTQASLDHARLEHGRLTQLLASSAAVPADIDRSASNLAMLEAQLASQRAQVQAMRIDLAARSAGAAAVVDELASMLADTEVRAPMDGVVLGRYVEPGEVVAPHTPLFKIGDAARLQLECWVDEVDIGRVSVGLAAAVSLYAFPDAAARGEVVEVLPDADRVRKAFLVKVRLADAPSSLRSGMSAEVNIIVKEKRDVLLVPREAIDDANRALVVRGARLARADLAIGVKDLTGAEVISGLEEGERVVVTGLDELREGMRVAAMDSPASRTLRRPPSKDQLLP